MSIRTYLNDRPAFEPEAVEAMSRALEEACKALNVNGALHDREVIAARIIDLTHAGVVDAEALSDRVIAGDACKHANGREDDMRFTRGTLHC